MTLTLAGVALLGACAGAQTPEEVPPAWFAERAAALDAQGTPALTGIPRGTDTVRSDAHWAEVARDLDQARAALRANPRSVVAPTDAEGVEAEALRVLENTRAQY